MSIGKRIKYFREKKDLRQKELAKKIGVSPDAVSLWETGLREPRAQYRSKLCQVFNISEAELFNDCPLTKKQLNPEIIEALRDPDAVEAFIMIHKSGKDVKKSIRTLIDAWPDLSPEKRAALLALCK